MIRASHRSGTIATAGGRLGKLPRFIILWHCIMRFIGFVTRPILMTEAGCLQVSGWLAYGRDPCIRASAYTPALLGAHMSAVRPKCVCWTGPMLSSLASGTFELELLYIRMFADAPHPTVKGVVLF